MRKLLFKILFGKNKKFTTALIGALVLFIALGCEKSTSFPADFQGVWESENRATLRFKENGKGDLFFMKDNVEFQLEDCLEYNAKEKTISCENDNPLGRTIKIDEPPKNGEMKLGGVKYFREEDLTKKDKPDEKELQRLVKSTILVLDEGLPKKDFEAFYQTLSRRFKARTSPQKLKINMGEFAETATSFKPIRQKDAKFSDDTKVYLETGRSMLKIKGDYDTTPRTLFDFVYVRENNEWKLSEILDLATRTENGHKD